MIRTGLIGGSQFEYAHCFFSRQIQKSKYDVYQSNNYVMISRLASSLVLLSDCFVLIFVFVDSEKIHISKFSKRNHIFPLHSQKLVTYFGQISLDFAFCLSGGCEPDGLMVFGEWRFLVWQEIQIRKINLN